MTWQRCRHRNSLISPVLAAIALALSGCAESGDDGGGPLDPEPSLAIQAAPLTWTYVPFADTACGNGEPYGLAINLNPASDKVMVFLDGGGWCWNQASCQEGQFNITNFTFTGVTEGDVLQIVEEEKAGILSRTDQRNPFKDYNLVFLPYCSGDMHFGTAGATEYGVIHQGARNLDLFLERLVPTFAGADHVILTGVSAGAFGALLNYERFAKAFAEVPIHLLSDSAPPLPGGLIPLELSESFWWSWQPDFPLACSYCRDFYSWLQYLRRTYPEGRKAFVASADDWLIRRLWGMNPDGTPGVDMPAETYYGGLLATVEAMGSYEEIQFFIDNATQHVYNDKDLVFRTTANEVALTDWLASFATGVATWESALEERSGTSGPITPPADGTVIADAEQDEAYRYPTDKSFTRQADIHSVIVSDVSDVKAPLQLTFQMAEVTSTWSPIYGFDHLAFTIFFDLPDQDGLAVLPEMHALAPGDFTWDLAHRVYGWGNSVYNTLGADADTRGQTVEVTPGIYVDGEQHTITFSYAAADLGVPSWQGVRVYVTTWDIDGISDRYRDLSPDGGAFTFGGGLETDPRIMDEMEPFVVPWTDATMP